MSFCPPEFNLGAIVAVTHSGATNILVFIERITCAATYYPLSLLEKPAGYGICKFAGAGFSKKNSIFASKIMNGLGV